MIAAASDSARARTWSAWRTASSSWRCVARRPAGWPPRSGPARAAMRPGDSANHEDQHKQARDQRERQHDRQDEPDPVTHGSPLPARGLLLPGPGNRNLPCSEGYYCAPAATAVPMRRAMPAGSSARRRATSGRHVGTGTAAWPLLATRPRRPASSLPAPLPRSHHRLRCRLDATTGPGPIGSARPSPPSCRVPEPARRSQPGPD